MYGDRGRLIQVLVNYLTNATRYGSGEIRIDARGEDRHIVINVHDNGPGVPKRHEEAIWDRFERGAHRFDATVPGSGIGLPIARMLVEAHGGTASYRRSGQLGGARFTMSIPSELTNTQRAPAATAAPV
jgi:signal transduction histidine kinase